MTISVLTALIDNAESVVLHELKRASAGQNPRIERVRGAIVALHNYARARAPRVTAAHAARSAKARQRRAAEEFTIAYRASGRVAAVVGWDALAVATGLKIATLRTRLSAGKGHHAMLLFDHETQNADSVVIGRLGYVAGSLAGRPRKDSGTDPA